ncbi:hypothetical protein N7507_005581 [Penicillium longicatenatum]|nr:hypothetical protein N7507_005581 [Penicillium longicatenatum]
MVLEYSLPHRHQGDTGESLERQTLKRTAQETRCALPGLLNKLNSDHEAKRSKKLSSESLDHLQPRDCPNFPSSATIQVINDDTLNVAVRLAQFAQVNPLSSNSSNLLPIIINFASHRKPGGGWLNGAMAQEESICYRSSLSLSLKIEDYPLELDEAIYSPYILVMRSDLASGHTLLESSSNTAEELPVISGITIAAIHRPLLQTKSQKESKTRQCGHSLHSRRSTNLSSPSRQRNQQFFALDRDRSLTKQKMRLVLRIAAAHKHSMLVLGALGCGVYANPPAEVAKCWLEVLKEDEFRGNWWRKVHFAVYDSKNEGIFETFRQILDGEEV